MSQAIFRTFILILLVTTQAHSLDSKKPGFRLPIQELFSHKKHGSIFSKEKIACVDCHHFSIKSQGFDPLAKNVEFGLMQANLQVCHQCHLGKVELPRVNQCTLCHLQSEKLAPISHNLTWKKRHGQFALTDPESCVACHKENQNSCQNCHSQKNQLRTLVHKPNFRLTHSIEARVSPAKCAVCHTNTNSCVLCHKGGFQ